MTDKARPEDDDLALFRQAMKDVRPLRQPARVTPAPPRRHRRPRPVVPPVEPAPLETPLGLDDTDTDSWHVTGLRPQDLRRLKKGGWSIEARLDLHGMTLEEGERALRAFLAQAHDMGLRHLLVIHGQGYNSEGGRSVLKAMVTRLLPAIPFVIAFHRAMPRDGGGGATYVLLRARA